MKNIKIQTILGFVIFMMFSLTTVHAAVQPIDKIVAVVNDGIITQSQLTERVTMIQHTLLDNKTPLPPNNILEEQVLDQMINQRLEIQLAEKNGIHVSDEEVNDAIANIAKQNNLTVEALYQDITKKGEDYALFRKEVREEMIIHQLQQREVAPTVTVTPQEVSDYLHLKSAIKENAAQYHVENILIALPEAPTEAQIKKAETLVDQLLKETKEGANFQSLAVQHSNDEYALKGGDLGWRTLAELPDIFGNQISTMKEGDIAGPFRTANGFHLIKLVGQRTVDNNHYTTEDNLQLKGQIANQLFQRKFEEKLQQWITELRSNSYIEIMKNKNV